MITSGELERIKKEAKLLAGNIGSDSLALIKDFEALKQELLGFRFIPGITFSNKEDNLIAIGKYRLAQFLLNKYFGEDI